MTDTKPTVHIVDDDEILRDTLKSLLINEGFSVEQYQDAEDFLKRDIEVCVGCVLLDLNMSEMSGLVLQKKLIEISFSLPIIFLTGNGDIPTAVVAIKNGAVDFLTKPVGKDELLASIAKAICVSEKMIFQLSFINSLTPREKDVWHYLVQGLTCKEISKKLDISIRTVEFYRPRIMQKAQATTISQLIIATSYT